MWEIYEHHSLLRKLPRIPLEVLKCYEIWKDIVAISGHEGLRPIEGFHDESFKGKLYGYRFSSLGLQYRLIYRIEKRKLYVQVIDFTS